MAGILLFKSWAILSYQHWKRPVSRGIASQSKSSRLFIPCALIFKLIRPSNIFSCHLRHLLTTLLLSPPMNLRVINVSKLTAHLHAPVLQLSSDYILWLPAQLPMSLSRYVFSSSSDPWYWLLHSPRSDLLSQAQAVGAWPMENSITLISTMKSSAILIWHQVWELKPTLMHYLNGGTCKSSFGQHFYFMF